MNAAELLGLGAGLSRESPVIAKQPRRSAESPTAGPYAPVTLSSRGRPKGTSPTQRSLKVMRAAGYLCQVVEHWNQFAHIRQDLYGFIDVLCVKGEDIVGVQATSGDNVAARVTKITEHENWPLVCNAIRIVVHGWRKNSKGRWVLREVEL
jgi:hypothetical protein